MDFSPLLQFLLLTLCGLLLLFVAFLLWNGWRRSRRRALEETAAGALSPVDIANEDLLPDALPVDEWVRLALEYRNQGEWRLAVRALYLATLATLAGQGMIDPALHKSNRDYRWEVARPMREAGRRLTAFDTLSRLYEQAWYGMYPVNDDTVDEMETNHEVIKTHEQAAV